MLASKKNKYLLFMFKQKLFIIEHQRNELLNQRNEPCRCAKSIHVWGFFLVQSFSRSWTDYGELQSKSPHSLRMWRNMNQTLHKKMKFFIKYFFSKCDQIHKKLRIRSHLLKKLWMKNFIFVQWNQAGIGTLFAQWNSEHCYVILIRLCCEFTVKSWLSDCEDMILASSSNSLCFLSLIPRDIYKSNIWRNLW